MRKSIRWRADCGRKRGWLILTSPLSGRRLISAFFLNWTEPSLRVEKQQRGSVNDVSEGRTGGQRMTVSKTLCVFEDEVCFLFFSGLHWHQRCLFWFCVCMCVCVCLDVTFIPSVYNIHIRLLKVSHFPFPSALHSRVKVLRSYIASQRHIRKINVSISASHLRLFILIY